MWQKYLPLATLACNTFNSPNYHKLVLVSKPKMPLDLETNLVLKVSRTYKDYYNLLNKSLQCLHKLLHEFKLKRIAVINTDRSFCVF